MSTAGPLALHSSAKTPSAVTPPTGPTLLTIAVEIREKIYKNLFSPNWTYCICPHWNRRHFPAHVLEHAATGCWFCQWNQDELTSRPEVIGALAAIKTCRQIYMEAINLLYTETYFYAWSPITTVWFLDAIGPTNSRFVRNLQFQVGSFMPVIPSDDACYWTTFFRKLINSPVGTANGQIEPCLVFPSNNVVRRREIEATTSGAEETGEEATAVVKQIFWRVKPNNDTGNSQWAVDHAADIISAVERDMLAWDLYDLDLEMYEQMLHPSTERWNPRANPPRPIYYTMEGNVIEFLGDERRLGHE